MCNIRVLVGDRCEDLWMGGSAGVPLMYVQSGVICFATISACGAFIPDGGGVGGEGGGG